MLLEYLRPGNNISYVIKHVFYDLRRIYAVLNIYISFKKYKYFLNNFIAISFFIM